MTLSVWDPFSELDNLHRQVNSLFNDTFGGAATTTSLAPTTDVYRQGNNLVIEMQLPNFKNDEIHVEHHDGELQIKAEHQEKTEDKGRDYLVRESINRYYRRFALPKDADSERIQANFENGVLKLTLPSKKLPQPKRIAISSKATSTKKDAKAK